MRAIKLEIIWIIDRYKGSRVQVGRSMHHTVYDSAARKPHLSMYERLGQKQ